MGGLQRCDAAWFERRLPGLTTASEAAPSADGPERRSIAAPSAEYRDRRLWRAGPGGELRGAGPDGGPFSLGQRRRRQRLLSVLLPLLSRRQNGDRLHLPTEKRRVHCSGVTLTHEARPLWPHCLEGQSATSAKLCQSATSAKLYKAALALWLSCLAYVSPCIIAAGRARGWVSGGVFDPAGE